MTIQINSESIMLYCCYAVSLAALLFLFSRIVTSIKIFTSLSISLFYFMFINLSNLFRVFSLSMFLPSLVYIVKKTSTIERNTIEGFLALAIVLSVIMFFYMICDSKKFKELSDDQFDRIPFSNFTSEWVDGKIKHKRPRF